MVFWQGFFHSTKNIFPFSLLNKYLLKQAETPQATCFNAISYNQNANSRCGKEKKGFIK